MPIDVTFSERFRRPAAAEVTPDPNAEAPPLHASRLAETGIALNREISALADQATLLALKLAIEEQFRGGATVRESDAAVHAPADGMSETAVSLQQLVSALGV